MYQLYRFPCKRLRWSWKDNICHYLMYISQLLYIIFCRTDFWLTTTSYPKRTVFWSTILSQFCFFLPVCFNCSSMPFPCFFLPFSPPTLLFLLLWDLFLSCWLFQFPSLSNGLFPSNVTLGWHWEPQLWHFSPNAGQLGCTTQLYELLVVGSCKAGCHATLRKVCDLNS